MTVTRVGALRRGRALVDANRALLGSGLGALGWRAATYLRNDRVADALCGRSKRPHRRCDLPEILVGSCKTYNMMPRGRSGSIVVFQDRAWFGGPKRGCFVVYVDGNRVGVAPVMGEIASTVTPGTHSVRIRQWWYRSPRVKVDVGTDAVVRLRADGPSALGLLRRMARMLLSPSTSLVLTLATPLAPETRIEVEHSIRRARTGLVVQAILGIAGSALAIVGFSIGPAVVVLGVVVFLVGTALGVTSVLKAHRR